MREYHTRQETKLVPVTVETVTCDKCKKKISYDTLHPDYNGAAHELVVTLDREECVNFYRCRDYCNDCFGLVWVALNKLINADPDVERDREYGM